MTDRELAAALAGCAASAAATRTAPSMRAALALEDAHRWRWVLHPDSIDLYADLARAGTEKALLLSSGRALHHARIALAADGRRARVRLLPDADPDHLATVTAAEQIAVTDEARELYDLIGQDPTSPRPGPPDRPPAGPTAEDLAELTAAARAEGVHVLLLDPDQVGRLAAATGLGRGRVAADRTDAFAVLYGHSDAPKDWLRAGAALSAVWLLATRRGLSVTPSTAAVSLPGSRAVLKQLLADTAVPYLALRLGAASAG